LTEIESELDALPYLPARHHARAAEPAALRDHQIVSAHINLEPAIDMITERAQVLTGASGAAIALRKGSEVICRARAGRTAPDIGVRLQTDCGISAECMRRGGAVLCHDAEDTPDVDVVSSRRLRV